MTKRHLALLALQTEIVYIVCIDPMHDKHWPPPGHETLLKILSSAAGLPDPVNCSLKETYKQCMNALLREIDRASS